MSDSEKCVVCQSDEYGLNSCDNCDKRICPNCGHEVIYHNDETDVGVLCEDCFFVDNQEKQRMSNNER